nr:MULTISPECIES: WbqC family protein [Nocardiopsis]
MPGVIGVPSSPSPDRAGGSRDSVPGSRDAATGGRTAGATVALHQPHYLPWLGLLDKIDRSDRFVMLDNVQFERRGWQNRNYVAGSGEPVLLTVPVVQGRRNDRIRDKIVDNGQKWKTRHYKALAEHCYRKSPYWRDYRDEITHLYEQEWNGLADLAIATTRMLMRGLGIDTPLLLASEMGDFPGHKSELLAQICAKAGATTMLSGDGARDYLEPEVLRRYGIDVQWQDFRHPVYPQHARGPDDFVPRLSAIDLLLNTGPEALDVLRRARAQN